MPYSEDPNALVMNWYLPLSNAINVLLMHHILFLHLNNNSHIHRKRVKIRKIIKIVEIESLEILSTINIHASYISKF